jgi:hypothetical protein
MRFKALFPCAAAIIVLSLLTGCAAVIVGGAAGAGTYAYISGELKVSENASLDRCWSATQGAMKDLEFTVTTSKKDALQGQVVAKTAADQKVEIRLTKTTDALTEIRIRVGTFGDQAMSQLIVQKIEKRL